MSITVVRIGHPPRLPLGVRRARLLRRLGRYGLAWIVVGGACYWMALGDAPRSLALLAIAGFICGPRRRMRTQEVKRG